MIEILKKKYWSKSEAFLLPLTGLSKLQKYEMKSYLFWENYSIEDYNMVIKFIYKNGEEFNKYCTNKIFPTLDKSVTVIESFDFDNCSLFIVDMSEWAMDVEMFLKGKYSKMSGEAKELIAEFHKYYDGGAKRPIHIMAALFPSRKFPVLDGMTGLEYVAENYGIDSSDLKKIGELASIYDKENETLVEITADKENTS